MQHSHAAIAAILLAGLTGPALAASPGVGLHPSRPTPGLGACLSQRFTPSVPSTSGDRGLADVTQSNGVIPMVDHVLMP